MKDLGHYTIEFERAGLKVKVSAGGLVALLTVVGAASMLALYLFQ